MDGPNSIARQLEIQSEWCETLGSPLYGRLLHRCADDVRAGGPVGAVLQGHETDPVESALALRFMGAVHRLVLEGRAPELAAFYPSAGGGGDRHEDATWEAFVATVKSHQRELRGLVDSGVQTNEVGRAGALVGGFLLVARETGLPLRVLETGASAGLNLRWDHYLYEARGQSWGDPSSPVRLCDYNSELPLPFDVPATVSERRGCDVAPLDPTRDEDRLTLLSYVWPDQVARIRLLRAALDVAARVPAPVDEASAPSWIERRLERPTEGSATVVFHSIFFQYLDPDDRTRFVDALEAAGGRATSSAPLAWLRMEPGGEQAEVRLTLWPGGVERTIATAGYHGAAVRWLV